MPARLLFKPKAYQNIINIAHYVAEDNPKIADQIDKFYKQTINPPSPEKINKLKQIIEQPGKNKFIISKNSSRATHLKKKLKKLLYTKP